MPDSLKIIDFAGGLYAVASGKDGDEADAGEAKAAIQAFIEHSGCFERDQSRAELGNIITPPSAQQAMGYAQMDYYVPVRIK